MRSLADLRKVPVQAILKEQLAVLSKFSPLPDVVVRVTLGTAAYGFVGTAAPQSDEKANEYFKGGGGQIFIPNLTSEHSNKFSLFGRI